MEWAIVALLLLIVLLTTLVLHDQKKPAEEESPELSLMGSTVTRIEADLKTVRQMVGTLASQASADAEANKVALETLRSSLAKTATVEPAKRPPPKRSK